MRHRLYFILPDLQSAQRTTNELLVARIEERHIHCLAKRGDPMDGLHEANILQKTDLVHGAKLGMMAGGIGGVILVAFLSYNFQLEFTTVLLIALGAVIFGAWSCSLNAARAPNSRLFAFTKDIEEGKYLVMVDVPGQRVDEIQTLLESQHPEAISGGRESTIPAFP